MSTELARKYLRVSNNPRERFQAKARAASRGHGWANPRRLRREIRALRAWRQQPKGKPRGENHHAKDS